MPNGRRRTWQAIRGPALLLASSLAAALLSGCVQRVGAGETAQFGAQASPPAQPGAQASSPANPPLLLDLPALLISYNPEGTPSIGTPYPLGETPAYIPEPLLTQLKLDKALLDRLAQAGIQHAMLSNTPSGLRTLLNGQPLPTLVWDQESLDNLIALVGPEDEAAAGQLSDLAATVLNLGVGVVVQIPPWSGADWPPPLIMPDQSGQSNTHLAQTFQQEFAQHAGGTPVIHIPVEYAADGTWTVAGITDTEWQALTGLPFGYLRLNPQTVSRAAEAGIRQVVLWTDADGVHLTIGGRRLPYLRWADGGFLTLLDLVGIFGYLPFDTQAHPEAYQLIEQELLPALQTTDLRIVVNFPPDES